MEDAQRSNGPSGRTESAEPADRMLIHELIHLHGHLVDEGEFGRLHEVFDPEVVYDVSALGGDRMTGLTAIVEAARALGDANPVAHHVTNVVVTALTDHEATAISKGLAVMGGGSCGSVVYRDRLVRSKQGWRIAERRVLPRRRPLHRSGGED